MISTLTTILYAILASYWFVLAFLFWSSKTGNGVRRVFLALCLTIGAATGVRACTPWIQTIIPAEYISLAVGLPVLAALMILTHFLWHNYKHGGTSG